MLSIRVYVDGSGGKDKEGGPGRRFKRPEDVDVRNLAAKRARFTELTGVKIDDVAGIVIDEVFFNTADVLGHADYAFRALTGNHRAPFGGLPVLLAGDAKQKQPPTGEVAYKMLVRSAFDPIIRGAPSKISPPRPASRFYGRRGGRTSRLSCAPSTTRPSRPFRNAFGTRATKIPSTWTS